MTVDFKAKMAIIQGEPGDSGQSDREGWRNQGQNDLGQANVRDY